MDAGLDSLGAVELRNTLATRFAVDLPATLTFDYPTVRALSQYLVENLTPVMQVGQMVAFRFPTWHCIRTWRVQIITKGDLWSRQVPEEPC